MDIGEQDSFFPVAFCPLPLDLLLSSHVKSMLVTTPSPTALRSPLSPKGGGGRVFLRVGAALESPNVRIRTCHRKPRSRVNRMSPLLGLTHYSAPRTVSAWKWKAVIRIRIQLVRPNPSNAGIPTKHNHAIPPSAPNFGIDVTLRVI